MSTEPDRDPVIDPLLQKALRPGPQTGSDGCVDAETLAAWADGNLPADLAAEVEEHLAGCSRCQAILSTFAMTDESAASAASPASVIPFKPRSRFRWLLPTAASVAATLALWTAVHNRTAPVAPEPQQRMARSEPPAPADVVVSTPTPEPPPVLSKKPFGASKKEVTAEAAASKASAAPTPLAPPPAATLAAPASPLIPPPQTRMQQPPVPLPPASNVGATGDVTTARTLNEVLRADSGTWALAKVVAEFSPPAEPAPSFGRSFAGGGGGRGGGGRATALPAERATPHVRWRVLASGQVMKSINDGEWTIVTMTPPVSIVNGHAPSPNVCWLVGRAGIVMLSTDGTKFSRVRGPDSSDLRSITAVDAHQATVTTTDGRIYTTLDAGETWQVKS